MKNAIPRLMMPNQKIRNSGSISEASTVAAPRRRLRPRGSLVGLEDGS